jgi:hypothetical protein
MRIWTVVALVVVLVWCIWRDPSQRPQDDPVLDAVIST